MLLSSCPRCHDSIRIPATAKEMSVIRCPRCSEQFPLSEIFSSLPPEAEIVSGPGSEVTIAVPVGLADTSEYNLTGESNAPKSDFQIKDSGPLSSSPPMAKVDSSRPPRKAKKSEPNVLLEFAKIVVGGAAGLAIAVLMIMWFGHQDVFKIVPKLPAQAYFIVPDELRTQAMKDLANKGNDSDDTDVPVESIPSEPSEEELPAEESAEPDDQVSRNKPVDNAEESPLAAAFQQQVNAAKDATTQKKPAVKPKPKANGRKVAPEKPASESVIAEESPAEPMKPTAKPMATEPPKEEPQAEPSEPTPIEPMLVEMISEASEELGPIGAEIPPPKQAGEIEPSSEGNVDLAPVDDDDN